MENWEQKLQEKIGWKPHKGQQEILKSNSRDIVICAGRRFGKTAVVSYEALKAVIKNIADIKAGKTAKPINIWVVAPCVDEKTEILTKRGWLTYRDLKRSDIILTLNKQGKAEWQKCIDIITVEKEGLMYQQELTGHSSVTTKNHRWLVGYTTSNPKQRVLGYRFNTTDNLNKSNEFVLGAAPVLNLPKNKTYSDALVELVGWWWTEGSENGNGINIYQNKGNNSKRIENAAREEFGEPQRTGNRLKGLSASWTAWRPLGSKKPHQGVVYLNKKAADKIKELAPDKVISNDFINKLTKEQLNLLLEVSVLADGHERSTGENKEERVITQKRKDRIDAIQVVAQLLGIEARIRKDGEDKYVLSLYRRNKHWLGQKPQRKKRKAIYYKGVVWCPKTPNETWLARRNGTVYFTGNTYNLTERVFEYFQRWMMRAMPSQAKNFKTRPYPQLNTKIDINGQIFAGPKVECKSTENPQGLLGEEVDLLIVDEAAQLNESIYNTYLYPTITSRQGRTMFISTPRSKNWFYRRWMSVNPEGGAFHFTSKDNPYFPKEEWERAKSRLPEQVFNQEFEAQFLDDAAAVFRRIDEIIDPELNRGLPPIPEHTYLMGTDLGKKHDFTAIVVIDTHTNKVVFVDKFREVDYNLQKERIKATAKKYNNALCVLDTTGGVADSIKDDLLRDGVSVDDYTFTGGNYGKSKKELVEKLMVAIEQGYISIPDNRDLVDELGYFGYEITPTGNIRYSAPEGENFHDDMVIALGLAVWNLPLERKSKITPIQEEIQKIQQPRRKTTFI